MARNDPEAIADLVLALWDRGEALEAKIASLEMNSRNSSKPPSSDKGNFTGAPPKKRERKKSRRKPGGRKGHKGHTLEQAENPDRIVEHRIAPGDVCPKCGAPLEDGARPDCGECERRQVFDLPALRFEITEHRAERRICANCGQTARAPFPEGVDAPAQYGAGFRTLALYLGGENHIPFHRLSRIFSDLFGGGPGVGALSNFVKHAGKKAEKAGEFIKQAVSEAAAAHFDETGFRLLGKLHWLHVASTARLTCYHIDEKRGAEAMRNFGILEKFCGRAVHDYFKSYYQFEDFLHALCNAHLIRELIFLHEQLGEKWAAKMIALLLEAKMLRTREDARPPGSRRVLGAGTRKRIRREYFAIVGEGRRENPEPGPPPPGRRGRPKRGKPLNMLDRLESRYDEIMAFFECEGVPFDNNQAERDIRMMKLHDKISGTFRSEEHARAFCNLRSVISTARKQGRNVMETLSELLSSPEALGRSLAGAA
jgi:transposase